MAGQGDDFARCVVELIDAGNGALGRHDRQAAAVSYARASELLFQKAAATTQYEQKLWLAQRAGQLLDSVRALKGEPLKKGTGTTTDNDPASGQVQPVVEPVPFFSGDSPAATAPRVTTGVTFADIAGLDEVKETLRLRMIYPARHPEKLDRYGLSMGGGMLLFGPPGTGKTLVARAVAGELDTPFFSIKPSDILSQYYGQSEARLAELFETVRGCTHGAVVFVDEIDAIGASRSRSDASEPSRRLLNQLLNELDGVHGRPKGLLFLAATNEPWLLDQALLRPPRFSEKCYIPLPDQPARHTLLELRLAGCPLASDVDLQRLSERTDGFSGADLVELCERAKQIPFREAILEGSDRPVGQTDLDEALRRVRPSVSPESLQRYERFGQGTG
jgi:transitional endoplasmic reticulum ATPase